LRAPGLTPRGFQRLNRKYDGPLSNFASNFNLRHYTQGVIFAEMWMDQVGRCSFRAGPQLDPKCTLHAFNA